MDRIEQRYAILFLYRENQTIEQIHEYLVQHAGDDAYSLSAVGKWVQKIKLGRTDLSNKKQPGRPKDEFIRQEIDKQIQKDPYASAQSIARGTQHSPTTVSNVLQHEFGLKFRHLQNVPHKLTDKNRTKRVNEAKRILRVLESAHRSHNYNIITGDESWFHYTNEPKARWVAQGEEVGTRVRESQFSKKKMVTIFIKRDGTFFVDLMPVGQTFDTDYFTKVIIPKINKLAFPNGFPKGGKKAYIHFDNAPPHKSTTTKKVLGQYPFILIPHPPYSPDISPLDFGVFGTIKEKMPYEELESDEELKDTITEILNGFGSEYIKKLFDTWIQRLHEVIDNHGEYIQ